MIFLLHIQRMNTYTTNCENENHKQLHFCFHVKIRFTLLVAFVVTTESDQN